MASEIDRTNAVHFPAETLWLEKETSFRDNYQYFRENATYGFRTTCRDIAEIQFRAAADL